MKGRAFLVRYADDFVVGFECEQDARRVMQVLPQRFELYGLTLHPEKTRLVEFKPPTDNDQEPPANGPKRAPRKFDFLGLTHHWGRSQKGKPIVQRSTASNRLTRALSKLREWMRAHRHDPVKEQWRTLMSKVKGHANYYGVIGNSRGISNFSYQAQNEWFKWLNRRGGKKPLTWARFSEWLKGIFRWPTPTIRRSRLRVT